MLGSLLGQQVVAGEQRVLHELVLQGTGLALSAESTPGPGLGSGLTSQAVLEELLILAPPVLIEERLATLISHDGCLLTSQLVAVAGFVCRQLSYRAGRIA